ncbi:MAG: HAD-IA family hydrolase [Rhodobacteraceae bacterium]|nr:HAD-IA family hydrolase [Paracoccaceae bacterium]
MSAEALILDFGGVISRTLFETHALSEAALGLPHGSLTWQGPFAPESDELWQSMQAGEMSEREYWHQRTLEVAALAGRDWQEMSDFVIAARGADPLPVIRPEALAAITKARDAGKRLAILSNELDLFYGAEFREKLPFLKEFDVIVDATYSGILKPDPRAYAECLAQLGLPAESCVFVDDQPRNIEGARAVGLACVAFDVTNPNASYRHALSLLGL